SLGAAQLSFGSATRLDEAWAFFLGDDAAAKAPGFDDRSWQRVALPHDWSVKAPLDRKLASGTGYLPGGIGWYRRKIVIPAQGGEKVFLYFEGVYNRSEIYLNGQLLGKRPNGYVSFYYDATPHVRFGEENTIAVRVDHSRYADSRWYTGSGIYRPAFLVRSGLVHLAPWGLFVRARNVDPASATLDVDTELQNESAEDLRANVEHALLDAAGSVVATTRGEVQLGAGSAATTTLQLAVQTPKLWSVASPNLYRLRTTVTDQGGRTLDQTTTTTGIRALSFDPDRGFALNGEGMKMKGVCLHHDAGVLGAAVPRVVWRKRLETLKELGCNAVRMSHNPQAPDVYELCDELGLLVMDEAFDEWEFPKRKWIEGWNVGEPGFDGSADFFEEWSARDLADMIRRNRNHPSIFAWSIGNEVDYPNDPYSHPALDVARISQPTIGKYKPESPDARRLGAIAQRLAAVARQHDRSRPVTAALAGVVMSNETEYPGALDIVGYNYTEDRYVLDHEKYPQRVIYGSENRHSLDAWRAVADNAFIFGQFLWTGIDYLGEARPWPSRGSSAGLLDLTGAVKPRGRFREALWSERPVIHVGTERKPADDRKSTEAWPGWNYEPGAEVRVLCYTNAARARLMLNGKPVGADQLPDAKTGIMHWDLPFEAGTLEVVGFDAQGSEIGRAVARTAEAPAAIRVQVDAPAVPDDGGVAMISVQIVDRHGVAVLSADEDVTCHVEGAGRLLGLEAGNLQDVSDYTDATHRTFRGRLVAYVHSTGSAGPVHVRFTAAGLPEASISVPTK
ncbi:MAG TPA: glycoside hydrolase family 2 TIM barrel-domain containing protein, partial [Opitutus sp.]|nr:glycoside hydrolase family 2 TIM barrel-domain containing protein [Opitutus sp.]